ncbi:hypothetical protein KIH86_24045 [Paenibacillus sp. HN-1]|uniref:hypothetical protein n=1 Tax=Paenibacillus TaxID=44249 RepID=UPI001CA933BA|nr:MULTISPECIES: hypothetical protein [Paenibacillus]MBY9081223.1 hypothetical protein [Paenibacillus sp. CGMCC 1.18879]MBY9087260.1 hypothetical protein [Paenibacillus sinensis]
MTIKKSEISEILLRLWGYVDQAEYDTTITDAFKAVPTKLQKKIIADFLENDRWDDLEEPDEETLEKARRIVGDQS